MKTSIYLLINGFGPKQDNAQPPAGPRHEPNTPVIPFDATRRKAKLRPIGRAPVDGLRIVTRNEIAD